MMHAPLEFRKSPIRKVGFTLVEVMISVGLGSLLLAVVVGLVTYGARTFVAMGNYIDLDEQSRNAIDVIGREVRSASAIHDFQTNSSARFLTLTNRLTHTGVKISYDASDRKLFFRKGTAPEKVLLTQCDQWDFWLYDRAPVATNLTFHAATNGTGQLDANFSKVINMSWNCSRTILGAKLTTESVQTAQIVLRNKVD
jgi:type II secretory pathway component PulJ